MGSKVYHDAESATGRSLPRVGSAFVVFLRELQLEFNPQGMLAERMRVGGAGIAGFYAKTGVGHRGRKWKKTQDLRRRSLYVCDWYRRGSLDRQ